MALSSRIKLVHDSPTLRALSGWSVDPAMDAVGAAEVVADLAPDEEEPSATTGRPLPLASAMRKCVAATVREGQFLDVKATAITSIQARLRAADEWILNPPIAGFRRCCSAEDDDGASTNPRTNLSASEGN
jgi:hypothetical protein